MARVIPRLLAPLALASLAAASAHAGEIAFVEASSQKDEGRPATWAYNAVDGKETTAWCSEAGASGVQVLSFGFERPVTITAISLVVGAIKSSGLDRSSRRARVVTVADSEHRVEVQFKDDGEMQTVELSPPAKGTRIVVEFRETYDGSKPAAPLCVGEVVLKSKDRALTGASIAGKLRALNTPGKRLLHEWIDDVSAPERRLVFNLDGTFVYMYEPLLEGKPARVAGKWSAVDRRITLEVRGKSYKLASRLTKVDEGDASTMELSVQGDGPHPSMGGNYRPAPMRLP